MATKKKSSNDKTEARPIKSGKDPLAEGTRLYNPTNTEAETHYKVDDSELKAEEKASKIRGKNANERAELHNAESVPATSVQNKSEADQEKEVEKSDRKGR